MITSPRSLGSGNRYFLNPLSSMIGNDMDSTVIYRTEIRGAKTGAVQSMGETHDFWLWVGGGADTSCLKIQDWVTF